jgi:DNA primase
VSAHRVELTNADRVLFPESGIAKRDLFDYYAATNAR